MTNQVIDLEPTATSRRLTIKYAGGMRPSEVVMVQPGVTAGELLQQLNLGGNYQVSKGGVDSVFGQTEPLWPRISDGDLVYVTSLVDAGAAF